MTSPPSQLHYRTRDAGRNVFAAFLMGWRSGEASSATVEGASPHPQEPGRHEHGIRITSGPLRRLGGEGPAIPDTRVASIRRGRREGRAMPCW